MSQPVRFIAAGAISSLLNWLIRIVLSKITPFSSAVVLSYAIGMLVGFVLYRSWVFDGTALPLRPQVYRFLFINALGLAVVVLSAKGLLAAIHLMHDGSTVWSEAVAHALAIVLGGFTNFLGHRGLTFAKAKVPGSTAARAPAN